MLEIDKSKLFKMNTLLDEYSLQLSEIIGSEVQLKITGFVNARPRDTGEEDFLMSLVAENVCELYGIELDYLKCDSRARPLPDARSICYTVIKERMPLCPLKKIGNYFGGRDHSTVLNGIDSLRDLMSTEPDLKLKYETIKAKITP